MDRRTFVSAALAAPLAAQRPPAPRRPRISCTSFAFHPFNTAGVPDDAIDTIGEIGFEGVELIVNSREQLRDYWTEAQCDALRKRLDKWRLAVPQFILYQPVVEGLTSLDPAERNRNLDFFEQGCRLAKRMNAPLVNMVAPWARELSGPQAYLPRYYDIENPKPGQKFRIDVAPGYDWDKLWTAYVATTKACVERAKRHGIKLTIEHHTHTMIPDASTFLLLWNEVRDPALGYNLDIGWTLAQREYPVVAIHKVKRQLMNLHMRDIDGMMRRFPHIGEGVMDFHHVGQALKQVGYSGFLSLEQDKHPGDMKATAARYLALMKEALA
jgi:sugar phosphate isomerase/epimerase